MTTVSDILLQQIVFLATASDSDVHPDVAVAQLESVTDSIGRLPESERLLFVTQLRKRMENAAGVELETYRELEESLDA